MLPPEVVVGHAEKRHASIYVEAVSQVRIKDGPVRLARVGGA